MAGAKIPGEVYAWVVVFLLPVNSAINPLLYTISTIRLAKVSITISTIRLAKVSITISTIRLAKVSITISTIRLAQVSITISTIRLAQVSIYYLSYRYYLYHQVVYMFRAFGYLNIGSFLTLSSNLERLIAYGTYMYIQVCLVQSNSNPPFVP